MVNPGYVHELAKLALEGASDVGEVARRNGVSDEDLVTATAALKDFSPARRDELIHELYVVDGSEKGYVGLWMKARGCSASALMLSTTGASPRV